MGAERGEPGIEAMRVTQYLLATHTTAYFSATERQRARILRLLDDAWRTNSDVISAVIPGGEWRHSWPEPARAALLALWSTPR